jgi:two-component system sensor histidine kinase MtrB
MLDVWAKPNVGASFRLTLPKVQGSEILESPLSLPSNDQTTGDKA